MMRESKRILNSDFWLDIIFPNRCPCCSKVIKWDKLICNLCSETLPYLEEEQWQIRYPIEICGTSTNYDYVLSAFSYLTPATEGIYAIKAGYGVNFIKLSAKILCDKLENDDKCDIDIITSVPMYRRKKISRGYNQADLLAKYIGKYLDLPVNNKLLMRTNNSLEQHSLNASGRFNLANEIYFINENHDNIKDKNILICDDVFTTGATMNRCASLLKSIGARKVYCVSICYTDKKFSNDKE